MSELSTHIVIPDTQVKPGVPLDHLRWIGEYIVKQFAGRERVKIIHLGDHWDMPSLSSYEIKGGTKLENQRIGADIAAGNRGMELLDLALNKYNAKRRLFKEKQWWPESRILLRGNHEDRITRAVEDDARYEGIMSLDLLDSPGWEVVPYLKPIEIDGVVYCHYFQNSMTGKPLGGTAQARLRTLGHSYVMGHQQQLDTAIRFVRGKAQRGIVAGACYLHHEDYKGYQSNAHWRGILILHEVEDGSFNVMEVSLDYLCRRFEQMEITEFLKSKYGMEYMA